MVDHLDHAVIEVTVRISEAHVGFLKQRVKTSISSGDNFKVGAGHKIHQPTIAVVVGGAQV